MSLQKQPFFLSYLKTLGVGPAGTWTSGLPLGRLGRLGRLDRRLSHWADRAAVKVKSGLFRFSLENTEVNENNEYLHFISQA